MCYYLGPGYDGARKRHDFIPLILGLLKIPLHNTPFVGEAESIVRGSCRCIAAHYEAMTYPQSTSRPAASARSHKIAQLCTASRPASRRKSPTVPKPRGPADGTRHASMPQQNQETPLQATAIPTLRSPAQRQCVSYQQKLFHQAQLARGGLRTRRLFSSETSDPATMSLNPPPPSPAGPSPRGQAPDGLEWNPQDGRCRKFLAIPEAACRRTESPKGPPDLG